MVWRASDAVGVRYARLRMAMCSPLKRLRAYAMRALRAYVCGFNVILQNQKKELPSVFIYFILILLLWTPLMRLFAKI